MEQRDYVEQQIEKIGLILNKLLSKIINLNNAETSTQINEEVNTTFMDLLNFDRTDFIKTQPDDLINFLIVEKKINPAHLEDLANIFYLLGKKSEKHSKEFASTLNNCITIYNYLEKSEGVFSFERNQKINEIRSLLSAKR